MSIKRVFIIGNKIGGGIKTGYEWSKGKKSSSSLDM